jgi:cell division FtsZ-interacting protein ZapD
MYDLISNYRSLTEKQRQELRMDEEDPIIAHERLDQMKQQVKEANKRMHAGEIRYEGKFEYKTYTHNKLQIYFYEH